MKRFHPLILLSAFLVLLIRIPFASAHRPVGSSENITEIPDITTSFAFYQELQTADQVHQFIFTANATDFFHASINIPAIDGLESYGVSMILMGPGLPALPADVLPVFADDPYNPATAKNSQPITGLHLPTTHSQDFFEPFTQTNYWGRQTLELNLPESGAYTLLIWNPEGVTGKYVMDTGTAEVFTLGDLFRFPIWWINVHAYFEHTLYMVMAGLGLAVLLIWRLRGYLKKKQSSNLHLAPYINKS